MRRSLLVTVLCAASAFAQTDGIDAQFKDPLHDNLAGRSDTPGHFREKSWHWLIEEKDQAGRWKTFAEYDLTQRPLAACVR